MYVFKKKKDRKKEEGLRAEWEGVREWVDCCYPSVSFFFKIKPGKIEFKIGYLNRVN